MPDLFKKLNFLLIILSCFCLVPKLSQATPDQGLAYVLQVQGPIGPAVSDYILSELKKAQEQSASLIILQLDTPGGLVSSTRKIIKGILNSPIPVATYVSPEGAHAASAGTYILYASHIAAMAPATNLGAATPVGGGTLPDLEKKDSPKDKAEEKKLKNDEAALKEKSIKDMRAYIRSLAQKRGRNIEWAESSVSKASTLSAQEALEKKVIEIVAKNLKDLLKQMDGLEVEVLDKKVRLKSQGLSIKKVQASWRFEILKALSSPDIAYMLLMLGFYGLLYELIKPGFLVPGVVGGICFLLGLYSMHILPVNYIGIALILLGLGLLLAEAFVPSFGILGIGGILALAVGSLMLFEESSIPAFQLSNSLVLSFTVISGSLFATLASLAIRAQRKKTVIGGETLIGQEGQALEELNPKGTVLIQGETWQAQGTEKILQGQKIKVVDRQGLKLRVSLLK